MLEEKNLKKKFKKKAINAINQETFTTILKNVLRFFISNMNISIYIIPLIILVFISLLLNMHYGITIFLMLCSLYFSIKILLTKEPINCVIYLILTFLLTSIVLISLGLEFMGLSIILVYIGAISVLFLFIIMILEMPSIHYEQDLGSWKKINSYFIYIKSIAFLFIMIIFSYKIYNYLELNDLFYFDNQKKLSEEFNIKLKLNLYYLDTMEKTLYELIETELLHKFWHSYPARCKNVNLFQEISSIKSIWDNNDLYFKQINSCLDYIEKDFIEFNIEYPKDFIEKKREKFESINNFWKFLFFNFTKSDFELLYANYIELRLKNDLEFKKYVYDKLISSTSIKDDMPLIKICDDLINCNGKEKAIIIDKYMSLYENKIFKLDATYFYNKNDINLISSVLYTYLSIPFVFCGLILLISMIGSIVLTLDSFNNFKRKENTYKISKYLNKKSGIFWTKLVKKKKNDNTWK